MKDMKHGTIYLLIQEAAKENYDKTAIIENPRRMTFGELSALEDLIAGTFPEG